MNILLLIPEYLPSTGGGITTFYRNLLPAYVALGHNVHVIEGSGLHAGPSSNPRVIDGVKIETLEYGRLARHLDRFSHFEMLPGMRRYLAAAWAMWEQANEGQDADIVEASDWGLLFVPALLRGAKPLVVQAHGSIGQIDFNDPIAGDEVHGVLTRLIEEALLSRHAAIQSYSAANASFWSQRTGRPVANIAPAWRPLSTASTGGVVAPSALVLGRVQHWKGPQVLCEALSLLGEGAPSVRWLGRDTVFGRHGQSTTTMLASKYPSVWGSKVVHQPQVSPEQAARLQRTARFNIVPSTWDVFNFTCVEAMASRRPVVCSTGAGASELIEDGVTGILFNSGDPSSLADAIARANGLSDEHSNAMARAAHDSVLKMLDPQMIAAKRLESYKHAIRDFVPNPLPSDDWLVNACLGREQVGRPLAFLDHMPLKPLLSYAGRRMLAKLTGAISG